MPKGMPADVSGRNMGVAGPPVGGWASIEPAARDAVTQHEDQLIQLSIAISLKRIADRLDKIDVSIDITPREFIRGKLVEREQP